MKFVLASASPRRKELLAEITQTFEVCPSNAEENVTDYTSPEDLVKQLAKLKAAEVAFRPQHEGKIVIGSDTVVAYEGEVLGKPKDEEDAFRMLKLLSGKAHAVYTGVCFAVREGENCTFDVRAAKTAVYFEDLSDEWIRAYIAGGSPMDKAGAYGIQDGGLVKKIRGSFSNVVGLPVELCGKIYEKIKRELGL
jgi:septum formation protein